MDAKKKRDTGDTGSLLEALKELLMEREASSQENICQVLEKKGYDINQSKVSRLLRKIGAIKVENNKGQTVYSLPREPAPPSMDTALRDLILHVESNETLVVIFTSPGSASMVARILDYIQINTEILGTIAGDDTIFVAPKSIKEIQKLYKEIKSLLVNSE
jgi:transcriptional regulator of arginine metabolism